MLLQSPPCFDDPQQCPLPVFLLSTTKARSLLVASVTPAKSMSLQDPPYDACPQHWPLPAFLLSAKKAPSVLYTSVTPMKFLPLQAPPYVSGPQHIAWPVFLLRAMNELNVKYTSVTTAGPDRRAGVGVGVPTVIVSHGVHVAVVALSCQARDEYSSTTQLSEQGGGDEQVPAAVGTEPYVISRCEVSTESSLQWCRAVFLSTSLDTSTSM
mmetsp:Transcript_111065/g.279258  ORF Transcript_111065/g.279258 Transcript_111065/m.279258 type:complete len:211 (+) Transcript_111065:656-1288(+)